MSPTITPTMEDYLETIFSLERKKKVVRVKDIARSMQVKLPSVTSMLNTLSQKGLVNHEKYEYVELTPAGINIAREIFHYHEVIYNFLKNILKIEPKIADEDACKIEHAISSTTLEKLVEFGEFIEMCPRAGADWLEHFTQYCKDGPSKEKCNKHMEEFIRSYFSQSSLSKWEKDVRVEKEYSRQ